MSYATFTTFVGFISHYLCILEHFVDECFHILLCKKCPCGIIEPKTQIFQKVTVALFFNFGDMNFDM